jgi:uncharacterized protein YqeY
MSVLETIKADQLKARLAKDKEATSLLTTLIGEASKISEEDFKAGVTEVSDKQVLAVITKFLKNVTQLRELQEAELVKKPGDEKLQIAIVTAMREQNILSGYLPTKLTREALTEIIARFKSETPEANMGQIMTFLKTNYEDQYEGKIASEVARSV